MEKKTINLIDINDDNINSALFLKYIKSYGFDPICYNNILELFQSVKGSMSQFLSSYKTYLLSSSVNYDELDKFKMNGALGYIEKDKMISRSHNTPFDGREVRGKVLRTICGGTVKYDNGQLS